MVLSLVAEKERPLNDTRPSEGPKSSYWPDDPEIGVLGLAEPLVQWVKAHLSLKLATHFHLLR
jgi:hypothetical protein